MSRGASSRICSSCLLTNSKRPTHAARLIAVSLAVVWSTRFGTAPTPEGPVVTHGNLDGSSVITGAAMGEPGCTPHASCVVGMVDYAKNGMCVFDCVDAVCHDSKDSPLALLSARDNDGNFTIVLAKPLVTDQGIYVTDGCTDPGFSPFATVQSLSRAPLMSRGMMLLLVAALGFVGLLSLTRLRLRR